MHTLHQRTSLHVTSLLFSSLHFTSLHFTTLHFSSPHFTSVLFNSIHFTIQNFTSVPFPSLHFTTLHSPFFTPLNFLKFRHHVSKTLHFSSLIITVLTLFLKTCDGQGKAASASAGSWFHSLIVLFTDVCTLFLGLNFTIVIIPAQVTGPFNLPLQISMTALRC